MNIINNNYCLKTICNEISRRGDTSVLKLFTINIGSGNIYPTLYEDRIFIAPLNCVINKLVLQRLIFLNTSKFKFESYYLLRDIIYHIMTSISFFRAHFFKFSFFFSKSIQTTKNIEPGKSIL